jgi:hypothetical protein
MMAKTVIDKAKALVDKLSMTRQALSMRVLALVDSLVSCSDLAYGKFVIWCVHGRLNCPICMDDSDAFRL